MKHFVYLSWSIFLSLSVLADTLPCTAKAAFGQEYGSRTLAGKTMATGVNSVLIIPATSFSPYGSVEVLISRQSRMVVGASGMATFENTEMATAFKENLTQQISTELKTVDKQIDWKNEIKLYTSDKGIWQTIAGEKQFFHTEGIELGIAQQENEVTLSCTDLVLYALHMKEVMEN